MSNTDRTYETEDDIIDAMESDELTEEQAIVLIDALNADDDEDTVDDPAAHREVTDLDTLAVTDDPDRQPAPGDRIVLEDGEEAVVAYATGNGAVALADEDRPKRTVAAGDYTFAD